MEIPHEAVRTLSDTAWGAIWITTVVCMGSAITYLVVYIRSLNRTINSLGEKRTQDAKDNSEAAQRLVREALEAVGKATRAIEELHRTVGDANRNTCTELGRVASALNCRSCPARAQASGAGGSG